VRTLRNWRTPAQLDRGECDDGLTSDEREELQRLRRENVPLKLGRDLLKRAAAFSAKETGDGLPDRLGGEATTTGNVASR
jgi:transposase